MSASAAVSRAAELAPDEASLLTRIASAAFFAGNLDVARRCVDRARAAAPRRFVLSRDLRLLDRQLSRREKTQPEVDELAYAFDTEPSGEGALRLARHLAANGQTYSAYYAAARGHLLDPDSRALRRVTRRLAKDIPADVLAEADEWAGTDRPFRRS
jgi:hypothetical protein